MKFDITSMADRQDRVHIQNTKTKLKKVNGISEYQQHAFLSAVKLNMDYQKAYRQDEKIFRRS